MTITTERQLYPSGPYELIAQHGDRSEWETYFAGVVGPLSEVVEFARVDTKSSAVRVFHVRRMTAGHFKYRIKGL